MTAIPLVADDGLSISHDASRRPEAAMSPGFKHVIATTLPPCTDHLWSVRATYDVAGRVKKSEWMKPSKFRTHCN